MTRRHYIMRKWMGMHQHHREMILSIVCGFIGAIAIILTLFTTIYLLNKL